MLKFKRKFQSLKVKVQWQVLYCHEYKEIADYWPSRIEEQGRVVQKYVLDFLHTFLCTGKTRKIRDLACGF